ncbi:hypothetical protein ACUSIJ_21740 [Pseudochelatococcus sp. B33]
MIFDNGNSLRMTAISDLQNRIAGDAQGIAAGNVHPNGTRPPRHGAS